MTIVTYKRGLWTLGTLTLSAAILTKLIPMLIAPLLLRKRYRQWLLCIVSVSSIYLFLHTAACSPFGSLSTFGAKWRHNDGVFGLLHWCYTSVFSPLDGSSLSTGLMGRWLTGDADLRSSSQLALFFTKATSGLIVLGYLFNTMRKLVLEVKVFSVFAFFLLNVTGYSPMVSTVDSPRLFHSYGVNLDIRHPYPLSGGRLRVWSPMMQEFRC